jgi:class 3 adenylate cyclase/predicted ATPase
MSPKPASPGDLQSWLASLGLEQYASVFAAQAVDSDVLGELSEHDLTELGIPLGHRRKLLRAIAKLRTDSLEAPSASVPERRYLTVMFCDLVGSTALSRQLDPEDLRPIIRAYQDCCAGIVARLDGFICRYIGDGILIYFGYPRAHEDDAERAVRASLEIVESVGRLSVAGDMKLQVRIGITTGLVVVGELIGSGVSQEVAAIGDAPNIAARLQSLATPDTIVVDDTTRHLTHGLFKFDNLGPQPLKGLEDTVQTWRAVSERSRRSRFEATRGEQLVPFVNRSQELGFLQDCWQQVNMGKGQVVLIAGEPGIGKSRLLAAFTDSIGRGGYGELRFQSSPHHQSTALYPFLDHLRRAARLTQEEYPREKLDKIAAYFAGAVTDVDEAVRVFGTLLSIPAGAPEAAATIRSGFKQQAFSVLWEQMATICSLQPLLVVVEDAHWLDPTSLELLEMIAQSIGTRRLMLLVTYRPEHAPALAGHRNVKLLMVNRLPRSECQTIVQHLASNKTVPAPVLSEIIVRTDGVALFVEELTKAVLESDFLVDRGDRYEITPGAKSLAIPSTLNGSLMARLDRNAGTRELAQVGSVIGREFSFGMLAVVSEWPDATLIDALNKLVASELLLCVGKPPRATYRFKHALVQDAAYENLLLSKRRTLHARVAAVLEQNFPDTVAAEPAVLAHHFARAGSAEQAIAYYVRAARLAIARSALAESITVLTKAMDLLPSLPAAADRRSLELEVQVLLGTVLRAARAPGAPETGRAWDRARELCHGESDAPYLLQVLYGQFLFHQGNSNLAKARELGEELLALGQRLRDARALVRGHSAVGRSAFGQGDLIAARLHLEKALSIDDEQLRRPSGSIEGPESQVLDLCYLAWALFIQGNVEAALRRCAESIATARKLSQPYDLVVAHGNACYFYQFRRDVQAVAAGAETVIALAEEKGFPSWLSLAKIFRGWALVQEGEAEIGLPLIERSLAEHRATGELLEVPYCISLLAECLVQTGRSDLALQALDDALTMTTATGEAWFEPELNRLRGEVLLAAGSGDAALDCLRRAGDQARQQGARMWECRAAQSLARGLAASGNAEEARALLTPLRERFAGIVTTAELLAVDQMLAHLPKRNRNKAVRGNT